MALISSSLWASQSENGMGFKDHGSRGWDEIAYLELLPLEYGSGVWLASRVRSGIVQHTRMVEARHESRETATGRSVARRMGVGRKEDFSIYPAG